MSYYNTYNSRIILNGKELFAREASLSMVSYGAPVYREGQRSSNEFMPTKGPDGTLDLQYYLTGKDFLREFLEDGADVISGNLAGLYFESGYLNSYSFGIDKFSPILVSANISFYTPITGTFSPETGRVVDEEVLTSVDASIYGTGVGTVEKIEDITYACTSELIPVYKLGEAHASELRFGQKEQVTSINSYAMTGNLPLEGGEAGMLIAINDKNGTEIDVFNITGRVMDVNNKAAPQYINKSSFSVRQYSLGNPPTISSFTPTSASAPGTTVTINGTNFKNVIDIFFFDTRVDSFTIASATQITTKVPPSAIDGKIKVVTHAGEALSATSFNVSNQLGVG